MSSYERNRGAAFEREVAAYFASLLGRPVTRTLGQARDGGEDILVPRLSVECKRRKKAQGIYEWLEQAINGADSDRLPTVIMRGDLKPAVVIMRLEDWTRLYAAYLALHGEGA